MTKTVFNQRDIDFTKQPMFFGEDGGVQRYDEFKYPQFDKLNQTMIGYFWRPEEVSLQKDRADFQNFRPEQKHIFTSNLKYQTLLDSVQGRGPSLMFLPYVSNPELEGCIVTWDFFETIHSRSYTHIMKNVYPDPSEVFDTIVNDKEILKRAKSVTGEYDKFGNMALEHAVGKKVDMLALKKQLYLAMNTVNLLEGLRFYVSFACTFAFGELKLMEGSAKIISLIARDENLHLAVSQNIINNYKRSEDDKQMLDIIKETEQQVYDMYDTAVQQEKDWAKFLFKDGSMIGLNDTLLNQYVEFMANKRMKAIGLKGPYDQPSNNNPLPWTTHWLNSRGLQNAPQETEIESYVVGGIKQDVEKETFKGFKL